MAKGGKAVGRLKRAGVSGYNKPKRTPNHPTKSHIVVAKEGNKIKTIRSVSYTHLTLPTIYSV